MTISPLATSSTAHERGCYPYRVVLARRENAPCPDRPFSTHLEVEYPNGWSFSMGHYDLTLSEACADYEERCRHYGLLTGPQFELPAHAGSRGILRADVEKLAAAGKPVQTMPAITPKSGEARDARSRHYFGAESRMRFVE